MKRAAIALLSLAILEIVLGRVLDAWGFGGKLLAMGPHTPPWALAAGLLFVVARVLLFVAGPGAVLALAVWGAASALTRRRARS